MALTLTALNVGAINFQAAAAIVLGSETGTTIKIVLSAIGGNAIKKRVVLGNLIFNIFLTVFAFIFLKPILILITNFFNISDPLIGLVTFSSLINLLGIIIFLPILNPFAKFLERFYKDSNSSAALYIGHANINEPETALDLFRRETEYFIHSSMIFNLNLFEIDASLLQKHPEFENINDKKIIFSKTMEEKYEFLKQLQGELQAFYLELRAKLKEEESSQLNQFISAVRSSMYSVKSIKDVESNITNLKNSSKDIKFDFFMSHKKETKELYHQLNSLMILGKKESFDKLQDVFNVIQTNYSSALNNFYKDAQQSPIEDLDITTAINFNRELFTSNKAMLMAVKDFLLEEKQAEDFNVIPVYHT
jgi:phosphate:Na+ symporter